MASQYPTQKPPQSRTGPEGPDENVEAPGAPDSAVHADKDPVAASPNPGHRTGNIFSDWASI